MNMSLMRDVGAYIKSVIGITPSDASAGAINGPAIDRQGYESCSLHAFAGAATGSPTTQSLDSKLQESADGSSGWTDITGAAITTITADDTGAEVDVDLIGVKQFIRVVQTVAFTGGTTPTLPNAATVVLGGAVEVPA